VVFDLGLDEAHDFWGAEVDFGCFRGCGGGR
jgi:hypothetical protein